MTRSRRAAAVLAAGILIGSGGNAVAQADSPCADFGGTLDGSTCQVHTSTSAYMLDMRFPVDYPDPAPMVDYLKQTRDGFVSVSQMPGSMNLPYSLDITSEQYRSGRAPGGTQTVVLRIYQNVGGAHPLTWYQTYNYNLNSRRPITFDTLFTQGSKPLPVILPIVQKALDTQLGSRVKISESEGLDPSHYQNFAITDDELIFFFGQGELLPSAAGATTARVPRSAVASMLAPL
ncbi:MAG: esterase [Mycobacterium sp.]